MKTNKQNKQTQELLKDFMDTTCKEMTEDELKDLIGEALEKALEEPYNEENYVELKDGVDSNILKALGFTEDETGLMKYETEFETYIYDKDPVNQFCMFSTSCNEEDYKYVDVEFLVKVILPLIKFNLIGKDGTKAVNPSEEEIKKAQEYYMDNYPAMVINNEKAPIVSGIKLKLTNDFDNEDLVKLGFNKVSDYTYAYINEGGQYGIIEGMLVSSNLVEYDDDAKMAFFKGDFVNNIMPKLFELGVIA